MGGCNSVFKRIALGAERLNDPNKKSSCDKSKTGLINATNQIIAMSTVESIQSACQEISSAQIITLTCDPNVQDLEGAVYEANSSCGTCLSSVYGSFRYQHQLEEMQWQKDPKAAKVRLPFDTELAEFNERVEACGLGPCKACSMVNVTQNNIISANASWIQNFQVTDTLKTNMTNIITQQLTQNQDVLAGVAQAFGNKDVATVSERLMNTITSNNFESTLQKSIQSLSNSQTISINDDGGSSIRNFTQTTILTAVMNAMDQNNIVLNNIGTEVLNTIEQVVQQQNTLNDFGEVVFESSVTLTQAVDNIVGRVMIASLIALGLVVSTIFIYLFYKAIRRGIEDAEEISRVEEQNRVEQISLGGF